MSISYHALLGKMELELQKAKQADNPVQVQGHMYAVKALAELVLESESHHREGPSSLPAEHFAKQEVSLSETQPMETEDGANGQSLFDF